MQVVSIYGVAESNSAGPGAIGLYGIGVENTGGTLGIGTGAYLQGTAFQITNGKALGAEIRVDNESTSNCHSTYTGIGNCDDIWLTAQSNASAATNLSSAVHVGTAGTTNGFAEGVTLNNGAVANIGFNDQSSATTSFESAGTHTYAVISGPTAGAWGIGTLTPSGTFDLEAGTAAASTSGANVTFNAQNAGSGAAENGGNIYLNPGALTGTGADGNVIVQAQGTAGTSILEVEANGVANGAQITFANSSNAAKWFIGDSASATPSFLIYDEVGGRDIIIAAPNGTLGIMTTSGGLSLGSTTASLTLGADPLSPGSGTNTVINSAPALTGTNDTAYGYDALVAETSGSNNTAVGYFAGKTQNGEGYNTFMGANAGEADSTGNHNAIFGGSSTAPVLATGSADTIIGYNCEPQSPLTSSTSNYIALCGGGVPMWYATGAGTPATGTSMIHGAVLHPDLATSSVGTTGTVCWTTSTGNLTVDTTTTCLLSDGRLKMNIEPLDVGIDEVMQLKPVSYDLKPEVNPTHLGRQVGLVAQDVIKVDPRLASVYQSGPNEGTPSGVRYEQMVALLVKGIQEQQHEIDDLKAQVKMLTH